MALEFFSRKSPYEAQHYGAEFEKRFEMGADCYIDTKDLGHFLAGCKIEGVEAFSDFERNRMPFVFGSTAEHHPEDVIRIQAHRGKEPIEIEIKIQALGENYDLPFFRVHIRNHYTHDSNN